MKRLALAALLFGLATPALAQQQRPATIAEMQGFAAAVAAQLDAVRSLHVQSEARAAAAAEENAKLQAEIKEMRAKLPKAEPDQK